MITIITIDNPFEPQKRRQESSVCTRVSIDHYFGDLADRDVYLNGHAVDPEKYGMTYPVDNDQIIITAHVAGGGLKSILGTAAMIALTAVSGGIAAGGIFGIAGKTLTSYLMSGAVMYLGGRLINSVFPQQPPTMADNSGSQTYGWDLPTISTTEGGIIGETYGTCIPAPQLLEEHVETASDGKQYLNILLCGGYGPVDSVSNVRIDRTPIDNFSGVQIETRLGTNDQEPISFFKNTPVDQEVSLTLEQDNPVIRTTDSAKASAIEITMEWSNGLYHLNNDGNYETTSVSFDIYYRLSGKTDWTKAESITVSNGSGDGFRKSYKYDVPDVGRYDVKIVMTSMPKGTRYMTNTTWSILTAYNSGVYSRPGKVLIGMRMLATNQLSGGLPSVNWRQTRSIVYVYNPTTSSYDEKPADNPIWAAYDILHGCRRLKNINTGSMEYVVYGCSHESLDAYYDEWVSAAAYSDEIITNHDGEKEKRFMFDAFYDTTAKRYDAVTKAAAVGHATIIVHGKNYGIVVDRPGTMTQIFSEGRTTVSSVNGTFTSRDERAHSVEITYNDEQNDFTNTQFTLRSPSYTTDNGGQDNTAQLTLFGVSRRSQAYREGITALATNERQLQFIELSTDIDGLVAEYGDIVGYNHAVSRIGIAGGRIISATAGTVTLDKSVDIDATKTYEIYIQMSDDVLVKREIVPKMETTNTLTLTQPFDVVPQKYDVYSFGETGKSVKPFRIVSASRDGDMLVKLKMAEYDEAVYATELDYSKYPIIDYTSSQSWASIRGVTAAESSRVSGGASISDIVVEWSMMGTGKMPDSYIVELTANDGSYTEQTSTKLTSCTFHSVLHQKLYTVSVSCVYDVITAGKSTTSVYVQGIGLLAANVRGLIIVPIEGGLRLTWTAADDTSVVGYDVYRGPDGTSISNCSKIATAQTSTLLDIEQADAGSWIFYVMAVDSTGKQVGQVISNIGIITLPGPVLSANAVTMYRQYQDGTTGYDIVVTYELPKNKIIRTGLVYYKINHIDATELGTIPEGVSADELGYSTDWKYAGNGESKAVISAAQLGDTYKLKIVAQDTTGLVSSDDDARYINVTIEAKTAVPNTPQNFQYKFSVAGGFQLSWNDVTNSDIDFYEIRINDAPGVAGGLLARVTGTNAKVSLTDRRGTLYLYAHNTTGKYSYPATKEYRQDKPAAPSTITISAAPRSAIITIPPIPEGAEGIKLWISDTETVTVDLGVTRIYTYVAAPGIYTVHACYYDAFGDGEMSADYTAVIKPTFEQEWIEDESISLKKIDAAVKNAIATASGNIPRIDQTIADVQANATKIHDSINTNMEKMHSDINTDMATMKADINTDINAMESDISGIHGNITDLQKSDDSITAIVAKNKTDQDGINAQLTTKITETADGITATVAKNKSDGDAAISQVNQRCDSITATVAKNKSDGDTAISQVSQKADSISSTITSNLNETDPTKSAYKSVTQLATQIKQTADSITSTVASNKSTQDATNSSLTSSISQVSQKADTISATVSANKSSQDNENSSLQSQISQNASSISSVVSSLNTTDTANSPYKSITALQSQVTQTANSLTSTISAYQSADSSLSSSISQVSQRCDSISSTVQSNKSSADTSISNLTQTANSISSTVQSNKTAQDKTNSSLSSQISQQSDRITSVITNLGKSPADSGYSAITQLQDAVNLRVSKGDVINQINLTAEGTTIDGKYLHVTGTTQFDNNVIVGGMIAAGAITADKMSASTITLSDNQGIQGGNVILDSRGMACTDSNGTTIQFGQDGMVSKDKNGNNFAILSQCMMGVAKNGKYVKFNNPWTETPVVIITPQNVQTNNPAYSTSQVRLHCYAEDVSANGFRVRAYSGIANGSGSFAQYQECGSMNWTIWRDWDSSQNMGLPYGSRSIIFTVKMPGNASRVVFHGRFGMNVGYKYENFIRFPNSASQNISIKCNGTETYNGMFFSAPNNNEIHGPTGNHGVDEYCSYTSNTFTVAQGSELTCTLTLNPWTRHDGDGSDGLKVWLIIDSLDVYVDGEQILDNDGTGAFFAVNRSNGLYTLQ